MTQSVACFTGRFQPFHNQHLEVVESLSHSFNRIIIGVTNPDLANLQEHIASSHRHTNAANPFSFEARVRIIKESLVDLPAAKLTSIDVIPFDLTDPTNWNVPSETIFALRIFSQWEASKLSLFSDHGFETLELQAPARKLSASEIRESLSANNPSWKN